MSEIENEAPEDKLRRLRKEVLFIQGRLGSLGKGSHERRSLKARLAELQIQIIDVKVLVKPKKKSFLDKIWQENDLND